MIVYECGNWNGDNGAEVCPFCGAEQMEEQPGDYRTVSITCDGWQEENES